MLGGMLLPRAAAEQQPRREQPVFCARSELVLVPVAVTDRSGLAITGLTPDQFQILDEHEPRPIFSFWKEDRPVSLGLVLDLSGSMRAVLPRAIEALRTIAESAQPEDEAFLLTCATQPRLVADFTTDPSELTGSLPWARADGSTPLIDSVFSALEHVRQGAHQRRALVVISDGDDNHSRHHFAELRRAALEADTQIYTLGVRESRRHRAGLYDLAELAGVTGGLHFDIDNRKDLPEAASRIALALRSTYVIGFRPAGSSAGKWRHVRVRLNPRLTKSLWDRRMTVFPNSGNTPHGQRPNAALPGALRVSARSEYFIPE